MKWSHGQWRNAAVFSIVLIALTGCSRHEGLPVAEESAAADQQLPFEAASDKAGNFPTGALAPTAVPAGTPVTIHLRLSLSSASSRPGDPFEAVLDEPIVVRGQTIAPRGAVLAGKVLDARAADQFQEPGYLSLALTAISLNGKLLPIQTSSIFVKRGSHQKRDVTILRESTGKGKGTLIDASVEAPGTTFATGSSDVGVAPERRLTFRLAQPLPL